MQRASLFLQRVFSDEQLAIQPISSTFGMASTDFINLALDEIVKKNRSGKKAGGARRSTSTSASGIRRRNSPIKKTRVSGLASSSNTGGKAVCRLANVPYNVSQEELETLFDKYRLTKVTLHYDFKGRSLGTAELHGARNVILQVKKDFSGVEIDGRPLDITVVGADGRAQSSPIQQRRGPRQPSTQSGARRPGGVGKRGQKPKLTAEQLDAELDEYMKGAKSA